jgi:hypothetical protein
MTYSPFDFLVMDLQDLVRAERKYASFVYVVQNGERGPVKIGAAGSVLSRLIQLQIGNPVELIVPAVVMCGARHQIELAAHGLLEKHWVRGEWFDVSPLEAVEAITQAAEREGKTYAPIWANIDDWFAKPELGVDFVLTRD